MQFHNFLSFALSTLVTPGLAQSIQPHTTYLIAPALITTLHNMTQIQCWNITVPFIHSSTPGTVGAQTLSLPTRNTTYTVIPPRFDAGLHNAPVPQLVHFMSGAAHITLPQEPEGAGLWIQGGKGGILFAVDTTGSGHITRYPSDEVTMGIVAPFEGGRIPDFIVVKEGGCDGMQTFI